MSFEHQTQRGSKPARLKNFAEGSCLEIHSLIAALMLQCDNFGHF